MFHYNACPRCNSRAVRFVKDYEGDHFKCITCGNEYAPISEPPSEPIPDPAPATY